MNSCKDPLAQVSSFLCNLPRTSQHCVSHPAPPAPASGQKARRSVYPAVLHSSCECAPPPLGSGGGSRKGLGSLTLLGNSSCRQEGSSWAPLSHSHCYCSDRLEGLGLGRIKPTEIGRDFPTVPRVNRTQKPRTEGALSSHTCYSLGQFVTHQIRDPEDMAVSLLFQAYQIVLLSAPAALYTSESRMAGSCVLVRFNGCLHFIELDP